MVTVTGFNRTKWVEVTSSSVVRDAFKTLFDVVGESMCDIPIEQVYPISHVQEAVNHAGQSKRFGKILLDLQG